MASVNKVMLVGNVTRDADVKYTPKGTAVAQFGMAMNRKFKSEAGEKEEVTFVDITAWGSAAEIAGKYVRKGKLIYVEGRLKFDSWEDNGQKKTKLFVISESFQLLGKKSDYAEEDVDL